MDFMTMVILVVVLVIVLKFIKASAKLIFTLGLLVVAAWFVLQYVA